MFTNKENLLLSELAYIDFAKNDKDFEDNVKGKTIGELYETRIKAQMITQMKLSDNEIASWESLIKELSYLKIVGYRNEDGSTGFCGAAFEKLSVDESGNEKSEIVFAMRGTEPDADKIAGVLPRDFVQDALIGLSDKGPEEFNSAENFVKETLADLASEKKVYVSDPTLTGLASEKNFYVSDTALNEYVKQFNVNFTGHSLGGALAQYVASKTLSAAKDTSYQYGCCTTFNAPGIYHLVNGMGLDFFKDGIEPEEYKNIVDYVSPDDLIGNLLVGLGTNVYVPGKIQKRLIGEGKSFSDYSILEQAKIKALYVKEIAGIETHGLINFYDYIVNNKYVDHRYTNLWTDEILRPIEADVMTNIHHEYIKYILEKDVPDVKNNMNYLGSEVDLSDILIKGTSDADTLRGREQNDYIVGLAGKDTIYGGGGDDYLFGNSMEDIKNDIETSDDINLIYGGNGNDHIFGGINQDFLFGDEGDDYIKGGSGNDSIDGGSGRDILCGDAGNDFIEGGESSDTIYGGDGDDTLYGDDGSDMINGGL
ncbi:MAG TPA: hypothetical protein VF941_07415, partial [Clostridia bacterium]